MEHKKEIALRLIAPYFNNPKTCGYDNELKMCVYLTSDGRMCVAGSAMNESFLKQSGGSASILEILNDYDQEEIFIPEFVDVFESKEWQFLQTIHDSIINGETGKSIRLSTYSSQFSHEEALFNYNELVAYAAKLNQ